MKAKLRGTTRVVDKRFKFDQLFDARSTQRDVFSGVRMPEMIEGVLDGYHGTVFAYGQVWNPFAPWMLMLMLLHQLVALFSSCHGACVADRLGKNVHHGRVPV